jgi:uncharacterized NAD(P)/FAD-binding protein YdhS
MPTVAVIGAGFSGSLAAVHFLRAGHQGHGPGRPATGPGAAGAAPLKVVLVERGNRFGRGVAYGTVSPAHLLNVPAGRMSAFEADGEHFLRWLKERDPEATGGAFAQRTMYGEYLQSVLDTAAATAPAGALERISAEATDVAPGAKGLRITLANGRVVDADYVVLAIGNFPPADAVIANRAALSHPRYIRDPWAPGALTDLHGDEPTLLIGTGLTMIDVALEIAARPGRAPIHAISRRGLLPQAHRAPARSYVPPTPTDINTWPRTALGMLRRTRAEVARGNARNINWRETLTALRAVTPQLWRSLPEPEQRRWLSHIRPFWETHRHRAAPEAWAKIEDLMRARRLRAQAARLINLEPNHTAVRVTICPRGGDAPVTLEVARVINCSGPETDLSRVANPLLRSLREKRMIATDPLGLGLNSTADGAAMDASGHASASLFVLGPLRRPQLWETTAVPELRIQAETLARHLLSTMPAK